MGVPAFYRWLSEKYPKIVQDVLEERNHTAHNSTTIRVPFDSTLPNPSGLECDNLYIDMNGIIHPCSHPEQGPQPKTEEEMYENVCRYVDRLFQVCRPRKLLYLAIDGVAPRAKMNQQRSRRFRSAQEAREKKELEQEMKDNLVQAGHQFVSTKDPWDSNVITPGTNFMLNLSEYIRFYIRKRISTDKAWKQICVIFSDASVPGEGEHKIMSHVRLQRTQPNYNPNLVHVLHGLDADLIMLALATHEAHFYILREEVLFGRKGVEQSERRKNESGFADAQRVLDESAGAEAMMLPENRNKALQRISIPILREYLAIEFRDCEHVPFKEVSFERLIDDIVFLCFFVGNDFLPHLPSLDIRDGALDFLFNVYKRILPTLGDYITNHGGEVNLSHVDVILAEVGAIEDHVFGMKHQNETNDKKRRDEQNQRRKGLTKDGKAPRANHPGGVMVGDVPKVRGRAARILEQGVKLEKLGSNHNNEKANVNAIAKDNSKNAEAAAKLKALLSNKSDNGNGDTTMDVDKGKDESPKKRKAEDMSSDDKVDKGGEKREDKSETTSAVDNSEGIFDTESQDDETEEKDEDPVPEPKHDQQQLEAAAKLLKQKMKAVEQKKLNDFAANVDDKVRLHESGWKNRYYTDKCKADDVEENGGREHLFRSYVIGLCWVMKYYYEGCPSWKWFYPFHYGPFASDLKNIERFRKDCDSFEMGNPFKPIEQLMSVFPEDSSHAIPQSSRWLMKDPESPIIDFYPKEIACDPNGKAMPWLWVVLLPFIDEERLLSALKPTEKNWNEYAKLCNARGLDEGYIYCHVSNALASAVTPAFDSKDPSEKHKITDGGIFGEVRQPLSNEVYPLDQKSIINPPSSYLKIKSQHIDELLTSPIEPNAALCAAFSEPKKQLHKSIVLEGAQPPKPYLGQEDYRIRRPRLNRGGGTIANMGSGRNGQSHNNGYGSMNISSYERNLAERSGRGNQMNQAGTRAWGAMEPTSKRQRGGNNSGGYNNNPRNGYGGQQGQYQPTLFQQPFQHGSDRGRNNGQAPQNSYQHRSHGNNNSGGQWQPPQQNHRGPPPPPQWRAPPNQPPPNQHTRFQHQQPPPRQGFSFQNFNGQQSQRRPPPQQHGRPQGQGQGQGSSGVSANVMNDLRSQLRSTLNRNKKGQN